MTVRELAELHARRVAAMKASFLTNKFATLRTLPDAERARVDAASREFRDCDALIVAELRKRPGPVRVGKVMLWLTNDGLNYAEVNPETGRPIFTDKSGGNLLYDYSQGKPKSRRVVPA